MHSISPLLTLIQSIWADIALTVGDYLFKRMVPDAGRLYMDVKDMKVVEAKVLHEEASASTPAQIIRIEGALDMSRKESQVSLFSANADGTRTTDRAFATATVCYEDAQTWHEEWQMTSHLVAARAAALWKEAAGEGSLEGGIVSKLSRGAVYQLFANVVDYGTRYRGMRQVALAEGNLEAAADILLDIDRHGTWHTPPHWIDSTFQVAGFVMNSFGVQGDGKSAGSSRDYFYITPGWRHFRLAEPLEAGPDMNYRNYVRMFPVEGELGAFAGDIYLLRGEKVVGVCAGIKFKRVPRALMPTMFPRRQSREQGGKRHDQGALPVNANSSPSRMPLQTSPAPILGGPSNVKPPPVSTVSRPQQQERTSPTQIVQAAPLPVEATPPVPAADGQKEDPRVDSCLQLIADETGLDLEELSDNAAFAELGVDSLLSITISEKMRVELGIQVKPSIFLECTTIRDLVEWIDRHAA
jgi:iterative type I PKS product template protein